MVFCLCSGGLMLVQAVLRMRVRISYRTADGQDVLEQTEVSGFPSDAFGGEQP